jgi:hypothetical protein
MGSFRINAAEHYRCASSCSDRELEDNLKIFVRKRLSAMGIPIPNEGRKQNSDGENKNIFGFKPIGLKD